MTFENLLQQPGKYVDLSRVGEAGAGLEVKVGVHLHRA